MSGADKLSYREMEKQIEYHRSVGSMPWGNTFIPTGATTTYVHPTGFLEQNGISATLLATLTDDERTRIRQIVAEEVAKVFPIPHTKPDVGIPQCPDCHGWVLDEHDPLTPLDTIYRSWWCVCPEKVKAWEEKCRADLDRLMEAIHSEDSEIEAVLLELSPEEFEGIVAKVRARRGQVT